MREKDYYHPESKEFYEARSAKDATLIQTALERLRIPFSPISFHEGGRFVERFYVKNREGHKVANEKLIVDLELSAAQDKRLLEQFEKTCSERTKYYTQRMPV